MTSFKEIVKSLSAEEVVAAVRALDAGAATAFGASLRYDVLFEGRRYAPKEVLGLAATLASGTEFTPADFSGGEGQANKILRQLGFVVERRARAGFVSQEHGLIEGRYYSRAGEIHDRLGGNGQGGISPSAIAPFIHLFSEPIGEGHFYQNGWLPDGLFRYFGEGEYGDMQWSRGNLAVREHVSQGRTLLLFEKRRNPRSQKFIGEFAMASWEYTQTRDKAGQMRQAVAFHLVRSREVAGLVSGTAVPDSEGEKRLEPKDKLREAAYSAAEAPPAEAAAEALRSVYKRSRQVRAYILARANGRCECCGAEAPFRRTDGTPYLEPHHIHLVSEGGADHPRFVAGICPTCHRRIHHGADGAELNTKLEAYLASAEPEV